MALKLISFWFGEKIICNITLNNLPNLMALKFDVSLVLRIFLYMQHNVIGCQISL
jgi:hypothetical protein